MRRFKGGTKTKESDLPEGHIPPEEHSPRSKHHVAEKIHKTISLAKPREQLDAYKTSRRQEKDEIEDDNGGSRIGNAVRRMSEQFMPNEDEKEAETRRASWTQPLDSRPQSRKNSAQVDIGSSSSSSPPKVHHDIVPTNMSPKEYSSSLPQMGPMNTIDSTSDEHSLYGFSDVQPRSPYNQPLYPPRPMAPFFRPTLSPVSSRSPVPTSTLHAASSPKPAKQKEPSKSVSISPQARSVVQDPSASSLHLPLPDVPASGSPIPISPIPPGLTVRNGAPNSPASSISGVSANKVALLSPIIETSSPEVLVSGAQKRPTVTAEDKIPQLDLSKESVNYTNTQSNLPAPKTVTFETPPKKKYSHQKTSVNSSSVSSAQFSEINRPQSPPPNRTPSPIKIAAITPSTSALEFWKEADESLHPSESASAQPPNYRGEPPPNFWKDADKNFRAQKHGPTMEEWIASLPGLGLGLGPWGNSDGALDLKYFQNLKATRKLQKRGSQRSIKTQELIRKNIENAEKAIEEIEVEGLTPEEAEAIISDDENEREVSTANQPPELIDPTLLHPNYTPGSSTASLPVSRKSTLPRPVSSANPQGRLGKDAASRLTAMEKYWDEQSSQMGTVLKRMLVVIDGLIIKEREESQKQTRGVQMGWFDSDDDGVYTKDEQTSELSNTDGVVAKSEWGCSVA
ncbi:hypothetical protein EDC01DRAFT_654507 [Geopyxis carbonaria]|nr:hypothetical protein EDC01DRAFT_654507 [Geopyxis carbonaria]